MSVQVTLSCNGCPATAGPFKYGWVFGSTVNGWTRSGLPSLQSVAPDGWILFDPYTRITYCPECWAIIEAPDKEDP